MRKRLKLVLSQRLQTLPKLSLNTYRAGTTLRLYGVAGENVFTRKLPIARGEKRLRDYAREFWPQGNCGKAEVVRCCLIHRSR